MPNKNDHQRARLLVTDASEVSNSWARDFLRAGQTLPPEIYDRVVKPARDFRSEAALEVWYEDLNQERHCAGYTPNPADQSVIIPEHKTWGVIAKDVAQDQLEVLAADPMSRYIPNLEISAPRFHFNDFEFLKNLIELRRLDVFATLELPNSQSNAQFWSQIRNLKHLGLYNVRHSQLKTLCEIETLDSISLTYPGDSEDRQRQLKEQRQFLNLLPKLKSLDITGWNPRISADHIANNEKLLELEELRYGVGLEWTKLDLDRSLQSLRKFEKLKALTIGMPYKYSPKAALYLSDLSQLRELSLNGFYNCNDLSIKWLAKLKKLKSLTLRGVYCNCVDAEPLAQLSNLEQLTFSYWDYEGGNQLEDGFCDTLTQLTKLQSLTLHSEIPATHFPELPHLQSLEIYGVSDEGLIRICQNSTITKLDIQSKLITNYQALRQLSELHSLSISVDFRRKTHFQLTSSNSKLRTLKLSLTGDLGSRNFDWLANLQELRYLKVYALNLSINSRQLDNLFANIGRLKKLQFLDVSTLTPMTEKQVENILALKDLRRFYPRPFKQWIERMKKAQPWCQ